MAHCARPRPSCEIAYRLIADGRHDDAIDELSAQLAAYPDAMSDDAAERNALLGCAQFHCERYGDAKAALANAIQIAPDHPDAPNWSALLASACTNNATGIALENTLATPPSSPWGEPSAEQRSKARRHQQYTMRRRRAQRLRALIVLPAALLMRVAVNATGLLLGYKDRIWTNWHRRPRWLSVLTIAYMRNRLNANSLFPPWQPAAHAANDHPPSPPSGSEPESWAYRNADGSFNNLLQPREGAVATCFSRNINPAAAEQGGGDLLTPNPRTVSRRLLQRSGPQQTVPFLNLLSAAWIQFQTHDWVSHGVNAEDAYYKVPLDDDDPLRQRALQHWLKISKTPNDLTAGQTSDLPAYLNEVTHWWDGSQLYGSSRATQVRLRRLSDGMMRLDGGSRLPRADSGMVEVGFGRNWWLGLWLLHVVFLKEHNAICKMLQDSNPQFDDERLFQTARLINAAVMAKIHTVEWTPALLDHPVADTVLNANWYGLLTNLFREKKDRKTLAQFHVEDPELGGVVGGKTNSHGAAYALTEEFVEVYRLHSLLPDELEMRSISDAAGVARIPLERTRQLGADTIMDEYNVHDALFSFGTQEPGALIVNNYPRFLQDSSAPGMPVMDLGAVDILRARERGVPRYNDFRRGIGLNPITRFEDLTTDENTLIALREVYGEDVEALDLLIGTLSEDESRRPPGFAFGETLFQIFILNATRRLQCDRFFTSCYDAEHYTAEGLAWVDNATLKTVLLRHFPKLAHTPLATIENAFRPWR